ncbi:MAG: hypothetical protein PHW03_02820 [Eubacteriales bacterium]|nr:hypothetical protein [Eubacteriales bacterium]
MTSITKAEKKILSLKASPLNLSNNKKKQVDLAIEKMETLVEIFTSRKRKVEKDQIDSLYDWFEDEFNVIYLDTLEKIEGKETNNG